MSQPPNAVPELLAEGVRLFNEAQFFQCHEVLEELWNHEQDPEKQFTQGILQIAVATHHLQRSNPTGAAKLYARGLMRVRPFAPSYRNIDVQDLLDQAERLFVAAQNGTQTPPFLPVIAWLPNAP